MSSRRSSRSSYSSSLLEDERVLATIPRFPVQLIFLEGCEGTLDDLLCDDSVSDEQLVSALAQVVFTLLAYQRMFDFTHNDLHTDNVMYVSTPHKHLYYLVDGKWFKVPTYGRLFKLIDFGRAIYSFQGQRCCSDSFKPGGDAAGQYNCEPFFQEGKARLEPSFSFDLCRLGCSMYEILVDDCDGGRLTPLARLVSEWCADDHGRNMLFKSTGEERYPNFKLYKMIARSVSRHTPQAQLNRPLFRAFQCKPGHQVPRGSPAVMNLDALPRYA